MGETPIYFTDSLYKVSERLLYITYTSLLAFLWFLYYPTTENYIIAFLLTLFAFILFAVFRHHTQLHYKHSLILHALMLIPFLVSFNYFKIKLTNIKFTKSTTVFVMYIILFLVMAKQIYT